MYSVFSLGFLLKRKTSLFNSLGVAGLITLLIEPSSIFDIGFQLSYFCVFFIILGFKIFSPGRSIFEWLNYLKNIFLASLFTTLGITPLISYHFGKIYPFSIFYNIFLIPFFALILMVNFIFIIFSFSDSISLYLGEVLNFLIGIFIKITQFLSSLKLSSFSYRFSFLQIIFYFIFLFLLFYFLKRLKFDKTKRI
jgi:competence protein ComEC